VGAQAIVVTALATTPVKGLRVIACSRLTLDATGVPDNRRFYLVDERGRMVNGKRAGELNAIVAAYRHDERALTLTFDDGAVVDGTVRLGEPIDTRFFSRPACAQPVLGPWSQALSEHVGRPLRIVQSVGRSGVDRGRGGAVTLISRASLAGLARAAGVDDVDARRFRMLFEIDGVGAHEEDAWVGRSVRIGEALVRFGGHVGRCSITTRHPERGVVDLPTLDVLRAYRGDLDATEPLPFGVYGEVLEGGVVAVGDAVVAGA
jgi:uncharacterized protein YcbX